MKILPVVFSVLMLGVSGCAYNGYQRGYVGYSSGHSSAYVGQSYYDYPVRSYYQPGGVIRYQQQYLAPSYPHLHDGHDDWRGRDRDWSSSARRQGGSRQHGEHGEQKRWSEDRSDSPHRPWAARAQQRQSNSESRRDWRPDRELRGSLGRLQHRSGPSPFSMEGQDRHGFGRRRD
ncbi:hypothetical protein IVG45_15790 [Methylomonas sp. LL1]|uniref:hypothetical protein n=1 Tax=Methylomonas sp. LL1 TaxID=2785785 RepID=UPI0018C3AF37|nr:hypothetical protein [Methylomonas sp. LL1]QPK62303.1 hypothetical protein IVG45_15790 [Methylomonas sp. LL1]